MTNCFLSTSFFDSVDDELRSVLPTMQSLPLFRDNPTQSLKTIKKITKNAGKTTVRKEGNSFKSLQDFSMIQNFHLSQSPFSIRELVLLK